MRLISISPPPGAAAAGAACWKNIGIGSIGSP
jgi:hypothetical protein